LSVSWACLLLHICTVQVSGCFLRRSLLVSVRFAFVVRVLPWLVFLFSLQHVLTFFWFCLGLFAGEILRCFSVAGVFCCSKADHFF
jgi:hypothetical protein